MSSPDGSQQEWTVASVLRWATNDFHQRGLSSPRLDAELLLSRVLKCDRVRLLVDSELVLQPEELRAYRSLIRRRRRHEPIAYILGVREFYGLPIYVDSRVLIPRPETELLVDVALKRTERLHLYGQALDLCTGSGCVAIAFASRRPTWELWASDISDGAVAVARTNALRAGARLTVRVSDLFSAFEPPRQFDLVTANPPYIPDAELRTLQEDVRDFEPALALKGGNDGLEFYRRLAADAPSYLTPGGVLALEVGHDQAQRVAALLEPKFTHIELTSDYAGYQRIVSGQVRD